MKTSSSSPPQRIVRDASVETCGFRWRYPCGRAACACRVSCRAAVTCRITAAISTRRTSQSSVPMVWCRKRPYALIFSAPSNTCRLPTMWPITKPTPIRPVTAITIFLPIVDRQKFWITPIAYVLVPPRRVSEIHWGGRTPPERSGREPEAAGPRPSRSEGDGAHRLAHRLGALLERRALVRRELHLDDPLEAAAA